MSLRTACKNACLGIGFCLGLFFLFRVLHRNRLLVLAYHGVLPTSTPRDEYLDYNFVPAQTFRWQMNYLKRRYSILPLSEVVHRVEQGLPLPPYAAVVTFDDGFRNNLTVALPHLEELGIPAVVFVATGFVGTQGRMMWTEKISYYCKHTQERSLSLELGADKLSMKLSTPQEREQAASRIVGTLKRLPKSARDACLQQIFALPGFQKLDGTTDEERYRFLNWSEITALAEGGLEIGSHTINHEILANLSPEEAWYEIAASKGEIERRLRRPCLLFSYPNGSVHDFSDRDKMALRQAGYRCAVSLIKDLNPSRLDLMALRRVNIGRRHNALLFIAAVTGFLPFLSNLRARLKTSG